MQILMRLNSKPAAKVSESPQRKALGGIETWPLDAFFPPMLPLSLRVHLLAGLVAGLFLSGCGSAAPAEAGPFAKDHASAHSWWPKAEAAFISGDPTALSDLYADSALDVAKGQMQMALLLGTRPKYSRPFRDSAIFAHPPDPTQTGCWQ